MSRTTIHQNGECHPEQQPNRSHLCQDLPRHDNDLQRLKRDVPPHPLNHALSLDPSLPRCHVRYHDSGNQQRRHGENGGEHDATGAAGALAALETNLGRVTFAANRTICPRQARQEKNDYFETKGQVHGMGNALLLWAPLVGEYLNAKSDSNEKLRYT